jgi:hypothetical protein
VTNGERDRIREKLVLFHGAARRAVEGSPQWVLWASIAMALGWVLDEPGLRDQLESNVRLLEELGVRVIADPAQGQST